MIEAATSSRAKCKGCKGAIAKGELRFGEEIPGNFDGMMTFWYHLACAAERRPEKFRPELASYKKPLPQRAALEASLVGATATTRTKRLVKVDRAPTGRASCQHCKATIAKSTLRVSMMRDSDGFMGQAYLHLGCSPAFATADVEAHLVGKAAKADKADVAAILRSIKLLDTDSRGGELEQRVRSAKKPEPEVAVLADWLEEQGCALPRLELVEVLAVRKKRERSKKKKR